MNIKAEIANIAKTINQWVPPNVIVEASVIRANFIEYEYFRFVVYWHNEHGAYNDEFLERTAVELFGKEVPAQGKPLNMLRKLFKREVSKIRSI